MMGTGAAMGPIGKGLGVERSGALGARMMGQGGGVRGRANDFQEAQFGVAEIMAVVPL